MVRFVQITLLLIAATPAFAQSGRDSRRPFEISDNSFLVEEAFNQEAGIFQNILLVQRANAGEWSFEFTQEWPLGGQRHQLSFTIPMDAVKPPGGDSYDVVRGTIALNYRLQLATEARGGPALSPRLSLLIPNTDGDGQFGVQLNLPVSKQLGDVYLHGNAGYTVEGIESTLGAEGRPHVAGSLIYRLWPMVHLMAESVFRADEIPTRLGEAANSFVISPGVRAGWNFGNKQLVLGAAVPLGLLEHDDNAALLLYFSYELPFKKP